MGRSWAAVIVAAGLGRRMKSRISKQYLTLHGKPIIAHTLSTFLKIDTLQSIIVVVAENDMNYANELLDRYDLNRDHVQLVTGGKERQHSVYRGLLQVQKQNLQPDYVLVHDGVRPFVTERSIRACMDATERNGAAILAIPVHDTIKQISNRHTVSHTPDRKSLWAVQTPQAFRYDILLEAYERAEQDGYLGTDDASLVERLGVDVHIVEGDENNIKITTPKDLQWGNWLINGGEEQVIRVGQGFDVHRFAEGRRCIIGGVDIPYEKGLAGHSDADVLLHAISDAILGAIGQGDIGRHFPDTDEQYKDADSAELLKQVWDMAASEGYILGNLDATIIAERPKMAPYIPQIVNRIAELLQSEPSKVNVKATTTERLGFIGQEEGIAAQVIVSLQKSQFDQE